MNFNSDEYNGLVSNWYDCFELGQPGDIKFYREAAQVCGGDVLELGSGTGRVLIPTAQAGVTIVGLDRSNDMISVAQDHISSIEIEAQQRITLLNADMRTFSLGRIFQLITIPNRSFLHLLTPEDQKATLGCVRDHLSDDGTVIFNIPDPHLASIVEDIGFTETPIRRHSEFISPHTGNNVIVWVARQYDLNNQTVRQDYIFDEISASGSMLGRSYSSLNLRLSYRYEMQNLLELCGFNIESLFGNFQKGPFHNGGEQIWVATKI